MINSSVSLCKECHQAPCSAASRVVRRRGLIAVVSLADPLQTGPHTYTEHKPSRTVKHTSHVHHFSSGSCLHPSSSPSHHPPQSTIHKIHNSLVHDSYRHTRTLHRFLSVRFFTFLTQSCLFILRPIAFFFLFFLWINDLLFFFQSSPISSAFFSSTPFTLCYLGGFRILYFSLESKSK